MKISKLIGFIVFSALSFSMLNRNAFAEQEVNVTDNTGFLDGGSRNIKVSNGEITLSFCGEASKTFKVSPDGQIKPLGNTGAGGHCTCLWHVYYFSNPIVSQPNTNMLSIDCPPYYEPHIFPK
jgi:hypothetical protein